MIIVPIAGDTVEIDSGLSFKVLSFTNYKSEGPAVIVEGLSGVETIFFKDIMKLNDQKVSFIKSSDGYKVLETDGFIVRKFQLPQPGDIIQSDISGIETRSYVVKRLKLNVKDQTSNGLIIQAEQQDTGDVVDITLGQIKDIEHYIFPRNKFLEYYSDYREKGSV